jgi:hypothetical protein
LELERAHEWVEPDSDQAADLSWFIEASEDAERRKEITSGASMQKLAELGSVPKWIRWLREQFEAAEEAALNLVQGELARPRPTVTEQGDPKWQMKVRLESASHSIRSAPLRWWNDLGAWIKLHPVPSDRSMLIADFTLPKGISAAWGSSGGICPTRWTRFYNDLTDRGTPSSVSPAQSVSAGNRSATCSPASSFMA